MRFGIGTAILISAIVHWCTWSPPVAAIRGAARAGQECTERAKAHPTTPEPPERDSDAKTSRHLEPLVDHPQVGGPARDSDAKTSRHQERPERMVLAHDLISARIARASARAQGIAPLVVTCLLNRTSREAIELDAQRRVTLDSFPLSQREELLSVWGNSHLSEFLSLIHDRDERRFYLDLYGLGYSLASDKRPVLAALVFGAVAASGSSEAVHARAHIDGLAGAGVGAIKYRLDATLRATTSTEGLATIAAVEFGASALRAGGSATAQRARTAVPALSTMENTGTALLARNASIETSLIMRELRTALETARSTHEPYSSPAFNRIVGYNRPIWFVPELAGQEAAIGPHGTIFLDRRYEPWEILKNFYHELGHAKFKPRVPNTVVETWMEEAGQIKIKFEGVPAITAAREDLNHWAYQNLTLVRFLDEWHAESFALRSMGVGRMSAIWQGFRFPLVAGHPGNNYGISWLPGWRKIFGQQRFALGVLGEGCLVTGVYCYRAGRSSINFVTKLVD